jgi:predicted dehydrogenase
MVDQVVKVALIGCGSHCRQNHAPAMAHYAKDHPDEVTLVATCDLDAERASSFAQIYGFGTSYTDHVKMLEKEQIDGVVAVMRIEDTSAMAIDLMRRGIPNVVEKPMGATLDEVRAIVDAAEETGTPNMVSVNRRFQPVLRRGVDWVREQETPIRFARAFILRHNRREEFFVSGTAIHPIDALREIGGDIVDHRAKVLPGPTDWYHFEFDYASGAAAVLDVLPSEGSVEEGYEIYGENWRVDIRVEASPDPHVMCWKDKELVVDEHPPSDEPSYIRIGPYAEMHEFVTALSEGRKPWPSVGEVYPSVELAFTLDPSKEPH